MRGNFCPDGAVAKITGKEGLRFSGPARVFDSEEDMLRGLEEGQIQKGDVIIIRYEGPQGGPGMREMLAPTAAIVGKGLGEVVGPEPDLTDVEIPGGMEGVSGRGQRTRRLGTNRMLRPAHWR